LNGAATGHSAWSASKVHSDSSLLLYAVLLVAAGLGSGFAGGLFGIGGGVLRVPIFLYLFPAFTADPAISMQMAAGTSLALGIPTGIRSALSQRRSGHLEIPFLRSWLPSVLVGVALGLSAARGMSTASLVTVFALAMLLIAVEMLALPDGFRLTQQVPGHPVRGMLAMSIAGLSSMIGVSGGPFTTGSLTLLGYPIHRALAVSAATAATISATGALGSIANGLDVAGRPPWSLGYVEVLAVGLMLPAVLVSAPLGVRVGNRLSERRLRRAFGVFLLVISADMLRRAFSGA
jgi:uncharacterized membrane protein YfcA